VKDDRLSDLFARRLLVVSGKGGVGKTTVAAALSTLAARSGRSVLLVSGDGRGDAARLFGKEDAGYVEAELAPGLRTLTARFDDLLADYVHTVAPFRFIGERILASTTFRYFTRATPGLPDLLLLGKAREVFRRGTSAGAGSRVDLLVLDAPATGHARSLLALPRTLLRTTPAGPLRRVGADVDRILADPAAAALVVVAEPAEFAAREAEELSEAAKREAGLATALVVVNRVGRSGRSESLPSTAYPVIRIPELEKSEELRPARVKDGSRRGEAEAFFDRFVLTLEENRREPKRAIPSEAPASRRDREAAFPLSFVLPNSRLDPAPWLEKAPLIVLTGPGGVGKTTLAAAAGLAAARRGRRALVLTVDPARRLAQALGLPDTVRNDAAPVEVTAPGLPAGGSLHALQIDPRATFERLLARIAPAPALKRIRENRLYAGLVDSLPGVLEYMGVEALYEHSQDGAFDLIVLDTPPASRGLDFLSAPDRMVELLSNDALRWFLREDSLLSRAISGASRGAAALLRLADTALGFGFLADLAEFFRVFEGLYGGFETRSREISALLAKGRFLVVSSVDASSLDAAAGIAAALVRRKASPGLLLNRLPPGIARLPKLPPELSSLSGKAFRESSLPAAELPAALADALD
jgi:anion-transporting  ArsA/GET3 family ATPase